MPSSGYFDTPFAISGDLNPIPDATQPGGTVSYTQGFPVGYSTPVGSGGFNVPRTAINQVLNDITTALQNWQQNTIAPFITSAMNGGTPFTYPKGVLVSHSGVVYQSNTGSNTDTPPTSKWNVFDVSTITNNAFTGGTTTGTANAQALSSVTPTSTTFTNGQIIVCTAGFTNTASATFTAPGGSALTIKKNSSAGLVVLSGGEIISGNTVILTYNNAGSCWVLSAGSPAIVSTHEQLITSTGTYTPSAGFLYGVFELVGGGGGGGGVGSSAGPAAAGGGQSGAYCKARLTAAQIGSSQSVTIGAGGAAGANTGGAGGNGGTSSLGALLTAPGGDGGGGTNSSGGAGAGGMNTTNATGGTINFPGRPGGPGILESTQQLSGTGGSSPFGTGGAPFGGNSAGNPGLGYGAGASGASAATSSHAAIGGVGTAGALYVIEYCSQ